VLHGDRFLLVAKQLMMLVAKEVVVVVDENVEGPLLGRRRGVEFGVRRRHRAVVSVRGNFVKILLHRQELVGIRAELRGFYFQGCL